MNSSNSNSGRISLYVRLIGILWEEKYRNMIETKDKSHKIAQDYCKPLVEEVSK